MDHSRLDPDNKIKSHWRHIRTRLYFTSASHMYTLLNVIKFGLKEPLNNNDKLYRSSEQKIDEILRLDFLSGIYFRVFENLISDENGVLNLPKNLRLLF